MSNENTSTKPLQEIAAEIAKALGSDWKRGNVFDDDGRDWRARIEGPNSERLFLSNTWGPKGKLHISGWAPDFVDHQTVSIPQLPHINVSLDKTPHQIAGDINRRLLPPYREALGEILKRHVADLDHKEGVRKTKYRVAEITGGLAKDDSEIIYGRGRVDIQVCGPDSLRFHGHCLYLTADQLARIQKAVPELFEKAENA